MIGRGETAETCSRLEEVIMCEERKWVEVETDEVSRWRTSYNDEKQDNAIMLIIKEGRVGLEYLWSFNE